MKSATARVVADFAFLPYRPGRPVQPEQGLYSFTARLNTGSRVSGAAMG